MRKHFYYNSYIYYSSIIAYDSNIAITDIGLLAGSSDEINFSSISDEQGDNVKSAFQTSIAS